MFSTTNTQTVLHPATLFQSNDQKLKDSILSDLQNLLNKCLEETMDSEKKVFSIQIQINESLKTIKKILNGNGLNLIDVASKMNKITNDFNRFLKYTDEGTHSDQEYLAHFFIRLISTLPSLFILLDAEAKIPLDLIPNDYFIEPSPGNISPIQFSSTQYFIYLALYLNNKQFLQHIIEIRHIPLERVGVEIFLAAVTSNNLEILKYIVNSMTIDELKDQLDPKNNFYGIYSDKAKLFLNLMKANDEIKAYIREELKLILDDETLLNLVAIQSRGVEGKIIENQLEQFFRNYSQEIKKLSHDICVDIISEIVMWAGVLESVHTFIQMTKLILTSADFVKIRQDLENHTELPYLSKQNSEQCQEIIAEINKDMKALHVMADELIEEKTQGLKM